MPPFVRTPAANTRPARLDCDAQRRADVAVEQAKTPSLVARAVTSLALLVARRHPRLDQARAGLVTGERSDRSEQAVQVGLIDHPEPQRPSTIEISRVRCFRVAERV